MAVSSGDPAPLVGHNAFLRWSAIREVSWVDRKDGERKFWSEAHVSEDFDLALRLQARGYIGRYCTYTGNGFQEGVSLTAADEVIRLRKYAYGSCEIMLNKFTVSCGHAFRPIGPLTMGWARLGRLWGREEAEWCLVAPEPGCSLVH